MKDAMTIIGGVLIVFLTIASVHDGRRISTLEHATTRLQSCINHIAVMAADGKSSVAVCQP